MVKQKRETLEEELFLTKREQLGKVLSFIPKPFHKHYIPIIQRCLSKYGFLATKEAILDICETKKFPIGGEAWKVIQGKVKKYAERQKAIETEPKIEPRKKLLEEIEDLVLNGKISSEVYLGIRTEEEAKRILENL